MKRSDYESPMATWWHEQREYVAPVLVASVLIGLCVWGIVSLNRQGRHIANLRARCEGGDMRACADCSGYQGQTGEACRSQLRAAVLRGVVR